MPEREHSSLDAFQDGVEVAEQWSCVFHGRTGARARAVFSSRDQAKQFAERHAQNMTATGAPLSWDETNDVTVLATSISTYQIVRIHDA